MTVKSLIGATLLLLGVYLSQSAIAQQANSDSKNAFELYRQHKYTLAAASFEKLIQKQPTPQYCYHAALSYRAIRQETRARQLFQFIVNNFPNSQEANYAQQVLNSSQSVAGASSGIAAGGSSVEMPASMKALIPPEMQKMMDTPAGKQALADAMRMNASKMSTIREADKKGLLNPEKMARQMETATSGSTKSK